MQEAPPAAERKVVAGREREALRPVIRSQDTGWRFVLSIQITGRLNVLREGVICRERQPFGVPFPRRDLQRVVPNLPGIQIVLGDAGELRKRSQKLVPRHRRTIDGGSREQALKRVRYLRAQVIWVAPFGQIAQGKVRDGQG